VLCVTTLCNFSPFIRPNIISDNPTKGLLKHQVLYWKLVCQRIWNDVWPNEWQEFKISLHAQHHVGQSENWIVCVWLGTCTCNIWCNVHWVSFQVLCWYISYWQCNSAVCENFLFKKNRYHTVEIWAKHFKLCRWIFKNLVF